MPPASRKKGKKYPKQTKQPAAPAAVFLLPRSWEDRLELCVGWVVCLIIVATPFVYNARLSNFADLPQRTAVQAGIALLCVFGLARSAVLCRLVVPRDICSCALAVFACWALASALWSANPYEALFSSVHWAACALAALGLIAWMHADTWLGRFVFSVVASGALVTALALCQMLGWVTGIPSIRTPSAAFANPNVLAEFLSMTIVVSVCAGLYLRRRVVLAALCWLVVAAGLVVLYGTACRSAWLAVVCACVWIAVLALKRAAGWKLCVPAALLLIGMAGYVGYVSMTHSAVKRTLDGSAQYRLIIWHNTAEIVKQRPVTGYGAGSFASMYGAVLNVNEQDRTFGKEKQVRRAHNDFVQTAAELGLPGVALLLLFFMGALLISLRLMVPQRTPFECFILLAFSGALVAFMVTACFGFPFQRALTSLLACMSAGMVISLYSRERSMFFIISRRGFLIAGVLGAAAAGIVLLQFNMGAIASDGFYKRAVAMEKRGNNAKALEFSGKAHALRPGRMDVLTTLGRAYITTGNLDEGIAALEIVTSRQPYNLNALFILGAGYANAGRSAEAQEVFRRVLEIKSDFVEARQVVSRLKAQGGVRVNFK
jgi:O-antigen ligase